MTVKDPGVVIKTRRAQSGGISAADVRRAVGAVDRQCGKCGETKPLSDFPPRDKKSNGEARYGYCRPCHNEYQREYRLRRVFGLSIEDHALMILYQGGTCAICQRPPGKLRLAVDHDHKTGLVRGLLCHRCNRLLGWVFDDVISLRRAAEYIEDPPVLKALGRQPQGLVGRVNNRRRRRRKPGPKAKPGPKTTKVTS